MATKLKRWKPTVSFAAFALGVSLILSSLVNAFGLLADRGWSGLQDAMQSDYQNTSEFRWSMSDYLEQFLMMAAGGPVDSGYYYSTNDVASGTNDVVVYDANEEIAWGWWQDHRLNTATSQAASAEGDPDYSRYIAEMQALYSKDKNVLYQIRYEGLVKYSNTDGLTLDGARGVLPEGYNFLMYFDGEKVTATKDGKAIDIYGDGYYREENNDWRVPGFRNFTIGEKTAKTTVTIAVAEQPLLYYVGDYAQGRAQMQSNSIYWLCKNLENRRAQYLHTAVQLLVGILLFALYIIWREDKRRADRVIARGTAHIPHELKWLIAVLIFLGFLFGSGLLRAAVYVLDSWEYGWYETFTDIFYLLYQNGATALIAFWLFYLLVNDLRYTPKSARKYMFADLRTSLQAAAFKLPFQQRMVQRYRNLLLEELALVLAACAAFFIFVSWYSQYGDEWILMILAALLLIIAGVGIWLILHLAKQNKAAAADIGALCDQITAIRNGALTQPLQLPVDTDLFEASQSLNDIQKGMHEALEEQTKSERMKVELITNVSHDIKTPLTSIISYVELLREEEDLPPHIKDYIRILDEKAQRLKSMVQDVFEVSKAAAGQLPVNLEELDLGKLLRQTLADMSERIVNSTVTIKASIPDEPVLIVADGQRLYRVFQNLLQNALQYSLEGSRVFVTLHTDGSTAVASVKNTSKFEIASDVNFAERFVRGDQSRTDGGSGLGLSIASNFTESCGGQFQMETIADLFVVTVRFPLS